MKGGGRKLKFEDVLMDIVSDRYTSWMSVEIEKKDLWSKLDEVVKGVSRG